MKKTVFLLGLLSLAALASCSIKDDLQQPEPVRRFYAVLEQPFSGAATKVYVDDTYHLFWNAGDFVTIFYDKTLNRQFMFDGETGDTAGGFERSDEDPTFSTEQDIATGFNYAIFPWHKRNGCDTEGNLKVIIPEAQEFYDDKDGIGARMLMVARAEGGDFYFKHVGSYIGVRLIGDGVSVKSISFQGNASEILAGRPTVSFGEDGLPVLAFNASATDNSTIITMELETPVELSMDTPKVFWLNVPAISLSGYTLTVTDPDGGTFQKVRTTPLTFQRTYFYDLDATVVITPAPVAVTSVSVSPTTLELNVGENDTLAATVLPENADDTSVTWSSSNTSVATVDANGKVTGVANGTATITATTTDGGKTATCAVTVKDVISYSLAISPKTAEINALASQTYVVKLTTVKNGVSSESEVEATLSTSDFGVATVDGLVATGVEEGTATITAKYTVDGTEYSDTATLTVKDVISYSLALTPATAEIKVGGTQTYTATLTTTKNGNATTSSVNATLSSSSSAATVNGMIATGASAGDATITAKYTPSGSSELSATATLTVTEDVITYALTIDPAEDAEVNAGSTLDFKLTLTTTTNGEPETSDVTASATWTSGDTAIATIAKGTATGVKEGNVTITAKYTTPDGVEKTLTAPLKVNKNPNQAGDDVPIGGGGSFGGN